MSDLALGIVGCSDMGTTHAAAIETIDGAELVAGADLDQTVAADFADTYECEAYTDHESMLAAVDLDAVTVCTPNGTHAEVVVDSAEDGVDVLCEKPLDTSTERMTRMIRACEDAGVMLAGIFQRRTYGEARRAKRAVTEGELGQPIVADAEVKWHRTAEYYEGWHGSSDLDGGILMTQAIHAIDWLEWIVDDVARVCATMETTVHDIEAPDTAVCALEFANGAVGQVTGTTAIYPQYPIDIGIHGTDGTMTFHEGGVDEYETRSGTDLGSLQDHPLGRGHIGQIRDFVEAIHEGREPMISATDARSAVDVVLAAEASARRGEWVDMNEFRP